MTSPDPAADTPPPQAREVVTIDPSQPWRIVNVAELWRYRELLWILALRDFKVRYKQTALGAAWAVLQPLITMVVFNVLFGVLLGSDNKPAPQGVPYPLATFCALLPWQLFAQAVTASSTSLVQNYNLVTKTYFPRVFVPAAPLLTGMVDFGISMVVLAGMMAWFGVAPGWPVLLLPVFVGLAVVTALGLGLWLSALNALYRDFVYTVPFLLQVGMFATPVVYASEVVTRGLPAWAQVVYGLNPMVAVVEGFRWALLDTTPPDPLLMGLSSLMSLTLLVSGLWYFSRVERTLTDWI